ncbi:dTMP kinase [Leuconostoc mesenteroides]|uniref:dTMP kinase n=1 Tax=Leuconostoc mesenteroides TaxID=1245 RepID=UPI00065E4E35|nr:dTMP kinase [Leuconostoc mesenteroides]AKP36297.1 thymidylate kinase [Leuconostoc mesenteroides subsp. dextranicum]MBZ1524141.1 dTMP kinase [Leuconostoc mesenteroides]MCT3049997.1 thymidylate kinase [Leuconostoc mesenteroides]ORI94552.1 dTMP kinase [Leuconostoc mesenteroides subsp. mesenteroides]ORI96026.1 dTMP kinase [Leuconostoc mesenteroides subsp. mesenteroides]
MPKPIFISFEGPEGAGKTSVLEALISELKTKLGDNLVTTREPGGNPISEAIRSILQPEEDNGMDKRTEALLYTAARRQHLVENIKPALDQNKIVISDRYVDSSLAYQGGGRGLGIDNIWEINQFAINGLLPDMTIYLDVPVEIGLARVNENRQGKIDRLDKESISFHQKVRETYLKLQSEFSDRIKIVDATQPLNKVIDDTRILINQILEDKS